MHHNNHNDANETLRNDGSVNAQPQQNPMDAQPQQNPMDAQPQMEDGGEVNEIQSASTDGEPPIQEMEQGGEVESGRLILDWGLVFTFFK